MTKDKIERRLFSVFNHTLTPVQIQAATDLLGVTDIIEMPERLKKVWQQIPAELETIKPIIEPVQEWLKECAGPFDFVLIQGDFGATWLMVDFAFKHGLVPVYSTTRREAKETVQADGSVKTEHIFQHQIFRRYGC